MYKITKFTNNTIGDFFYEKIGIYYNWYIFIINNI